MKKFLLKLLAFVLITVTLSSAIAVGHYFIVGSQYSLNYQAIIKAKLNRLNSIDDPKIILVGHSALAFGMDSQKVEEAMGMLVVNLGMHGGLGNAFHEEMAKQNINEGDIVVICHSTFSDGDKISDPALAWITYDCNIELLSLIRPKDYVDMLKYYPDYLKSSTRLWLKKEGNKDSFNSYSLNAFNKWGDVVYKPEKNQMDTDAFFAAHPIEIPSINNVCINRLNELNDYVTSKGATMVVAGYPIAYGKYAQFTEEDFRNFQKRLDSVLDCAIISDYTDYFFPYEYFYDTYLHLNEEGTAARTNQLISDLKKHLGK